MRRNLVTLFALLNRGTRRRLIAANVGLSLGVLLVVLFVAAGLGLRDTLLTDLLGTLPITQLKVQPRVMEVGVLRLGRSAAMGGGALDPAALDRLADMPEVEAVYPIAYAHFPVSIEGELLGSTYGTDAPLQGVDPAWVAREADPAYTFAARDTGAVPILLSRKVLQAYNVGFARANGLPQLTEGAIIGQTLSLDLGSSFLGGTESGREIRPAVICGFSDKVDALALGVPLGVVRHYAERFESDDEDLGGGYDAAIIEAREPGDLTAIETAASDLGLELAPDAYLGRQVGQAVTVVILMLTAVGIAVVALSLMNMANTMHLVVRERQYELGVVRAVGMSEGVLAGILVAEASLSGLLSAVFALAIGAIVLWLGALLLAGPLTPILGTAPSFQIPFWLIGAALALTPLASALAAVVPARQAVGASIATSLRR